MEGTLDSWDDFEDPGSWEKPGLSRLELGLGEPILSPATKGLEESELPEGSLGCDREIAVASEVWLPLGEGEGSLIFCSACKARRVNDHGACVSGAARRQTRGKFRSIKVGQHVAGDLIEYVIDGCCIPKSSPRPDVFSQ